MMKAIFLVIALLALTGCHMPGEDDYSTIPATNNPAITREKSEGMLPGMNY
jgi:hypothetical protein